MTNNDNSFKIKGDVGFPNPMESFEIKKTHDWGLTLARAIQSEQFYNHFGSSCRYFTQRDQFLERRMYARGLQSMTKYHESLGTNGDLSFLNLSKKPITIIPKLVDIVVNGMVNRGYQIKATAIDQISQQAKEQYRKQIEDDRLGRDIAIKIKEELGAEVTNMPLDQIPETDQEMQLHLQLEYKPSYEISQELAITDVLQDNDYEAIVNRQVIRDLVELGVACVKTRFEPSRGILTEYVNMENKLNSYTDDPYFRDCFYHGEIKRVLISEILTDFPFLNDAENEHLKEQLIHSGTAWDTYYNIPQNERIKGTATLMYFTYKTTRERFKKIKERATGEKLVSDADPYFDANKVKKNDYKRVSKVEEVLFEGVFVPGTDLLLRWEVSENMARPKSNKQKVCDQYIMIAPNKDKMFIDSLVARMMSIDDLIQITELKAQQMIQRMMPDGYFIDEDALAEVDLGEGNVLKPQGLLDMFFQTGSIVGRSLGAGGEYNYAKIPITELKTAGNLQKLQALRTERDSYRNDQLEVIGFNKASAASTPDKDSLVGLQKLASLNSNIATRHILDSSLLICKRVSENITYHLGDIFMYHPELKKDLERRIGKTAVENLTSMKDSHLRDFAIYLDLELDEEERAKLEADMSMAIEKGYLALQDKYKILNVRNFKQAVAYMSVLMEKHSKKMQEQEAQKFKIQADENIRASQTAEQFKQQTIQMEAQADAQKQQMISETEIAKEQIRGEETRKSLEVEYSYKTDLQYVINEGQVQKQQDAEDRKDAREDIRYTNQSKENYRKEVGGEPIDFEQDDLELEDFNLNN